MALVVIVKTVIVDMARSKNHYSNSVSNNNETIDKYNSSKLKLTVSDIRTIDHIIRISSNSGLNDRKNN